MPSGFALRPYYHPLQGPQKASESVDFTFFFSSDLFGMHLNKPLYTLSYMCVTAGASGFLFSAIYTMVDVSGNTRLTDLRSYCLQSCLSNHSWFLLEETHQ